ncbi:MAG: hypothetical protein CMB99_12640 [Flavobacteriaceae bacterium]|nr:hypothetical protein [Flavobacteriaceae bacterium]|tara:strand:- start:4585 stop:4788 length:204 start_codon:yes stop_codon:yes gene_type:complete
MKNVRRQLFFFAVLAFVLYFSGAYLLENGFKDLIDGIVMMIFFGSIIPFMGKLLILIKQFTLSQQSE